MLNYATGCWVQNAATDARRAMRRRQSLVGFAFVLVLGLGACKEPGAGNEGDTLGQSTGSADGGATGSATTSGSTTTTGGPAQDGNDATGAGVTGISETIHYVGRFAADANGYQIFSWSGCSMSADFTGTAISMTLDEINKPSSLGPNMYSVSIDNKTPTVLSAKSGGGTYVLASSLAQGTHTVRVTKRTEASIGPARFRGFTITGGSLTPKVSSIARRILMVGDSITCGYGVLGTSSTCSYTTATQNIELTYGALAGAHFNADVQYAAWSGKGIYRNNDGTTDTTMGDLFNLTEPSNSSDAYDWSQFVPDAIVVNLGTNDFSASLSEPAQATFASAYLKMLATLYQAYPKAHVFLVAGPMVIDNYPIGKTYLTDLKSYLAAIAQAAQGSQVTVVDLTSLTDAQKGCDSHPNQAAHAVMSQSLQAAMSASLGW